MPFEKTKSFIGAALQAERLGKPRQYWSFFCRLSPPPNSQDGNGRLSRVLTTLLLLQSGYAYVPYSSLESVIEQNKEAYYLALRQTQVTIRTDVPDWQPWLSFFLTSLAEQVKRLARKVEREKIVLATLPNLSLQIVEFAREHGRITIGEATKLTGANRNTLKQHFRALVEQSHLNQQGSGRGAWYELR